MFSQLFPPVIQFNLWFYLLQPNPTQASFSGESTFDTPAAQTLSHDKRLNKFPEEENPLILRWEGEFSEDILGKLGCFYVNFPDCGGGRVMGGGVPAEIGQVCKYKGLSDARFGVSIIFSVH